MKEEAVRAGTSLAAYDEHAVVETTGAEEKEVRKRVDKMYLDLTDGENLAFRYAL